jgi:putative transport protein
MGLGVTGVLFAGIIAGHLGIKVDKDIMDFAREFGLILFVFTIGLQLGPGFFASLRDIGIRLNMLAAGVVLLGAIATVALVNITGLDAFSAAGLFSGATTNTPSLGAVQQTVAVLKTMPGIDITPERAALPALAYALGYPIGILAIIASMLVLRFVFRIDPEREAEEFKKERQKGISPIVRMNLAVENPNLDGIAIADIPGRREMEVVVSRIKRPDSDQVDVATDDAIIHTGDRILAIGTQNHLDAFQMIVGRKSGLDLMKVPGRVSFRRVVVTRKQVLGKTISELGLDSLYGVTITRVVRADVEMTADPELKLQFGDFLHVVGDEENIAKASNVLGDSLKVLNQTHFIPIFLGILLGVAAGLIPFHFSGLPVPVRLGVAGGPLIIAILLARLGKIGPLVWFMPATTNTAMREMGIIVFLACVGLKAGEQFVPTLLSNDGLIWLGCASIIAFVPIFVIGLIARAVLKMNFVPLCGLLSGSMTDPPALAFANSITKSESPSVAYATIYPLTMLLRIMAAQVLVLILTR